MIHCDIFSVDEVPVYPSGTVGFAVDPSEDKSSEQMGVFGGEKLQRFFLH